MSGLSNISFESVKKTRKSIVVFSLLLMAFSNLSFTDNEIDILGLRFIVERSLLVGFTKLALIISLTAFAIALAPTLPIEIARFKRRWDERWWAPKLKAIHEFYSAMDPQAKDRTEYAEFRRDSPDFDDIFYQERHERAQNRLKIQGFYRPVRYGTLFISRFLWPLSLAAIAIFCPEKVVELSQLVAG